MPAAPRAAYPEPGPRYVVHPDADYRRRLDDEDVDTWYGTLCKAAQPRGFSRQDKASGPSGGDLVVTSASTHRGARLAYGALLSDAIPDADDFEHLEVLVHEHTHCLVRLQPDGSDVPEDVRRYSHPDTSGAALLHVVSPSCGFAVNAFTGVLRLRPSPRVLRAMVQGRRPMDYRWDTALSWFHRHMDDTTAPWRKSA